MKSSFVKCPVNKDVASIRWQSAPWLINVHWLSFVVAVREHSWDHGIATRCSHSSECIIQYGVWIYDHLTTLSFSFHIQHFSLVYGNFAAIHSPYAISSAILSTCDPCSEESHVRSFHVLGQYICNLHLTDMIKCWHEWLLPTYRIGGFQQI